MRWIRGRSTLEGAVLVAAAAVLAVTLLGGVNHAGDEVRGMWGTTDTSTPESIEWPEGWTGAKDLRAQWWKLFPIDPGDFRPQDLGKGWEPFSTAYNWRLQEPVPEGTKLLVEGDFPHCRLFTFQIGAPWDPEFPYGGRGGGAPEVPLLDEDIVPDPGHVNPFVEGANRTATKRHYHVTFELREGKWLEMNPTGAVYPYRAPGNYRVGGNRSGENGESGPSLWVRIYMPDHLDPYGGVAPPVIRIQYPGEEPVLATITEDVPIQLGEHIKLGPEENPALVNGRSLGEQQAIDTLRWEGLRSLSLASAPDVREKYTYARHTNPDGTLFLVKRFGTQRHLAWSRRWRDLDYCRKEAPRILREQYKKDKSLPPPGNDPHESDHCIYTAFSGGGITLDRDTCVVIRGKAPITPRTRDGQPVMGSSAQLRYFVFHWDIGIRLPLYPIGGISDEDLVLDADRNYTIVIGAEEDRPANATAEYGITWYPFVAGPRATFNIRWLSTAATSWKHAPHTIPWEVGDYTEHTFDRYGMMSHMGDYYPEGRYMTTGEIEKLGRVDTPPYHVPKKLGDYAAD
jgi:hypothetical protein